MTAPPRPHVASRRGVAAQAPPGPAKKFPAPGANGVANESHYHYHAAVGAVPRRNTAEIRRLP